MNSIPFYPNLQRHCGFEFHLRAPCPPPHSLFCCWSEIGVRWFGVLKSATNHKLEKLPFPNWSCTWKCQGLSCLSLLLIISIPAECRAHISVSVLWKLSVFFSSSCRWGEDKKNLKISWALTAWNRLSANCVTNATFIFFFMRNKVLKAHTCRSVVQIFRATAKF